MEKTDHRRAEIAAALADAVLAGGLQGRGLRDLAAAAGISDRMLLYYFADKDAVIAATLDLVARRFQAALGAARLERPLPYDALLDHLNAVLCGGALRPHVLIWIELAAGAARGDAAHRRAGEAMARAMLVWIAGQIDSREKGADSARMLATLQGMAALDAVGLDTIARAAR